MMIVLLIISVLILIAIPNVTKHSATIDQKGCQAYVHKIRVEITLRTNLVLPRLCEGWAKHLIVSLILNHIFVHKKIEVVSIQRELVALRESFIHRLTDDVKHFHNFLMYLILTDLEDIIKKNERSFYRYVAVETPLFVVHEGQPLNLIKSYVRDSLPLQPRDISHTKRFPCLPCVTKVRTTIKGHGRKHCLVTARAIVFRFIRLQRAYRHMWGNGSMRVQQWKHWS